MTRELVDPGFITADRVLVDPGSATRGDCG